MGQWRPVRCLLVALACCRSRTNPGSAATWRLVMSPDLFGCVQLYTNKIGAFNVVSCSDGPTFGLLLRVWGIFGTGGWRRLHDEERHALYSSPDIIWVMKSSAVGMQ